MRTVNRSKLNLGRKNLGYWVNGIAMEHEMNTRPRIVRRSFMMTCAVVVFVLVALVQEACAGVLVPASDRPIAPPTHADVWEADDQVAAQIASQPLVLSLSTASTDLVRVLMAPHSESVQAAWRTSLFEIDQDAQRFTFNLLLQGPSRDGPIHLAVRTVNLASRSPVVPVASSPSSALLFVPALVGLLGVLLREQHRVTASGSNTESMAGQPSSENVPCLLIVSTDPVFSDVVHAQVHRAGYLARIAGDVNDTLTISEHVSPAVLLVDRRVPDWDMLRTSPLLRRVPLITLVPAGSLCTDAQWVSDLERGADSTYDFRDGGRLFLAKLRAFLRRAGCAVTGRAVYQVGAIRLDADHHEVMIAGQQLPLSAKPFAILKTLMEAPSKVFSRRELVDRVWGPQFAIGEHTLDVHVHALRRQLDRAPQRLCRLITIKGVGFKLKAEDSVSPSAASIIARSARSISGNWAEEFVTPAGCTPRYAENNPSCPLPLPHAPAIKRVARRSRNSMQRRPTAVGRSAHPALVG